jgi:hypothetical protein
MKLGAIAILSAAIFGAGGFALGHFTAKTTTSGPSATRVRAYAAIAAQRQTSSGQHVWKVARLKKVGDGLWLATLAARWHEASDASNPFAQPGWHSNQACIMIDDREFRVTTANTLTGVSLVSCSYRG